MGLRKLAVDATNPTPFPEVENSSLLIIVRKAAVECS